MAKPLIGAPMLFGGEGTPRLVQRMTRAYDPWYLFTTAAYTLDVDVVNAVVVPVDLQ